MLCHLPALIAAFACTALVAASDPAQVAGTVEDPVGAAVSGAEVSLLKADQAVVATTRSDASGRFRFDRVSPGTYLLLAKFAGFSEARRSVVVREADVTGVRIRLEVMNIEQDVTVTASRGSVGLIENTPRSINLIDERDIWLRATSVVVQAAAEEPGVQMQRTSPTIGGVFVRGLTGNKVNVFVDGVRFSTSAQRGGISTFLDLVDPSTLEGIEILRGPNSDQYGSDALGGSVQFVSRTPVLAGGGGNTARGSIATTASSADAAIGVQASASYSAKTFGILANGAARRIGEMRPGRGIDSHAAVTRFFGLRSDVLMDHRLPDTGFRQYGGLVRFNWTPGPDVQVVAQYRRGVQQGGRRYDQLLGGDGNLVADLRDLTLDLFYAKVTTTRAGWFDDVTATYSINTQREERVNQGGSGDPAAAIVHEPERTTAHGFQVHANRALSRHALAVGGDFYPESVSTNAFGVNPVTGVTSVRRGRVPDNARYRGGGAYAQDEFSVIPNRLTLLGSLRYSAASYTSSAADSPLVSGRPLWPDDHLRVSTLTFRTGANYIASDRWTIYGSVSRGFRAPHITDLGTLGLTGSGFEVAAPDVASLGATVGDSAAASASSTGRPVRQVGAESSLSYEGGLRFKKGGLSSTLSVFVNNVYDNIQKQALILPPGAVGIVLGGQPIVSQGPTGTVFVSTSTSPVLVRDNYDNARIVGAEHVLDWRISRRWSINTAATWMRSKDTATGRAPSIEGGTPAPEANFRVTYAPGRRFWVAPSVHAVTRQDRLSSLDLEDRRTGATRTRSNIRNFFLNGARARGWIGPGPDGFMGSGDDVLLATGETLAQVQDRVLGAGVSSAPLFTALPGYVTLGVRTGMRFGGNHEVVVDAENLTDRSYRGISWGVDAPGIGITVRYRTSF